MKASAFSAVVRYSRLRENEMKCYGSRLACVPGVRCTNNTVKTLVEVIMYLMNLKAAKQ